MLRQSYPASFSIRKYSQITEFLVKNGIIAMPIWKNYDQVAQNQLPTVLNWLKNVIFLTPLSIPRKTYLGGQTG